MKENVLVTRGLTKRYGHFVALQPTDFAVPKRQIYGLVGKNGAGKTTLLRMISGQTTPTMGDIELFGQTGEAALNKARRRTGAMIEAPSFFPYLTADQNLEYYRIQRGVAGKECVRELLEEVGLTEAGKKKFKDFSLGMKQRLGLALALMNHPDLLLLDEPVNGLDPMGIVEFRNLILRLNKEKNITIVISSHILSEMANLATCYGFIDHGVMLEQVSALELNARCRRYIELRVDNVEKTAAILEQKLACTEYEVLPGQVIHLYQYLEEPSRVSTLLIGEGVQLSSLEIKGANLEDYFVQLVGGESRYA